MGTKEKARQPVPQASFICEGEYWTLAFEDRLIRLRDSRGLRQLAVLLREPGREFHVLDLGARIDPREIDSSASRIDPEELARLTVRSTTSEGDGELLDAQARAEYKQRRVELTEELEDAREFRDEERVARIEDEIDLVTRELKAAFGLTGRSRKPGSAAEQARVNVTKNIDRALDQIDAKHESLGRFLKSTVQTGIFCSYQPDPRFPVAWSFETAASAAAGPSATFNGANSPAAWLLRDLAYRHSLVGRQAEVSELRRLMDQVAISRRGTLAMIAGAPGVGKTRLIAEIVSDERWREVAVGHCYENERVPYQPFVEILEGIIRRADSPEALRAPLGSDASELARLLPSLRQILPDLTVPPEVTPDHARRQMFEGFCNVLGRMVGAGPGLLVVEDLHWADESTLSMLMHLVRRLSNLPLLVLGSYRDSDLDINPALARTLEDVTRERSAAQLGLRGLTPDEVARMVENLSSRLPPGGLVTTICKETAGNPFFIEELLRYLEQENRLYDSTGHLRADLELSETDVPPSVRLIVGRRFAGLRNLTQRVLATAAVMGQTFAFDTLETATGVKVDELLGCVEEAQATGLLAPLPGARFEFRHELGRQAVLSRLSQARRQRLHLSAAEAIESVHQTNLGPHVGALAGHYRMAGAAADPEKAVEYSMRAGSAAYAVFAYEEAGAHWQAALELIDEEGGGDRKRRAELLWLLGDELVSDLGAKAIEYLEAAAPLFEELGDSNAACDVHSRLGLYLSGTNIGVMDVRRAMLHYKKTEAFLATQPESARHALFYLSLAGAHVSARRIGDGIAAGKRAMEICERQNLDAFWCSAAVITSLLLVLSGSVTEGLQLADRARRRAEPIDETLTGSTVAWLGGANCLFLADPREAQDWFTHELAKPRTARSAIRRAILHQQLAVACTDMGELAKVRAYLAEAHAENEGLPFGAEARLLFFEGQWELADKMLTALAERARTSENRLDEFLVAGALAQLRRFSGESSRAVQFVQLALKICVDGGDILNELTARSALAAMIADAGDIGEALPHLQRCRQIVGAGENWLGLAGVIECAEAVVAAAQVEYTVADTQFKKAIATFQHYCLPWEEATTLQYWGRALLAAGEHARAIEKFDAAIDIYRSHGASTRFIEYVMADKTRARDPKSTHPAA